MSDSYSAWCDEQARKAQEKDDKKRAARLSISKPRMHQHMQVFMKDVLKLARASRDAYKKNNFGDANSKVIDIIRLVDERSDDLGLEDIVSHYDYQ